MKTQLMILGAVIMTMGAQARAQDWKPCEGPLKTRWAKDVSPDNALPEYPRPQMVRKDWLNLNGLWDLARTSADGTAGEDPGAVPGRVGAVGRDEAQRTG